MSTALGAMYEPRRATAGGTTRVLPACSSCAVVGLRARGVLQRHLVEEARVAGVDDVLSCVRKYSSTAFLSHWFTVHWPSLLLRDARLARIEQLDALLDGVAQRGRRILRVDVRAPLEGLVDGGGESGQVGHLDSFSRKVRMRCAAITHSSTGATSEMRTRCRPGLPARVSRAR